MNIVCTWLAFSSASLLLFSPALLPAQTASAAPETTWRELDAAKVSKRSRSGAPNLIEASTYRLYNLNPANLLSDLAKAPVEGMQRTTPALPALLSLPAPDGTWQRFQVEEASIMEPGLQAEFPDFRTYVGRGVDDPAASARLSVTALGFHAQVLTPQGAWYIDPFYHLEKEVYMVYAKRDALRRGGRWSCLTPENQKRVLAGAKQNAAALPEAGPIGSQLRTFRLACAATAEYTAFFGGTVAQGQAAIVVAINRVTGVYELETGIRLTLVANNSSLVFTNAASDPYTNDDPEALLTQNQARVDSVIGNANYDIGHVFSTAGGGLAGFEVVCITGLKAQGETGLGSPTGDPFYIDYVAHEIGHQFGGDHTFNVTDGNREATAAYEPGSGSTIMAYAGLFGAGIDLQSNSDPYFHTYSFDQIVTYVTTGSGNCRTPTATGNQAPTVSAGPDYTIPNNTTFALTATGSDPDGDTVTYCWEQMNLGASQATLATADNGASPLFRSFLPTTNPTRTFPRLANILAGTASTGEKLPTHSTGAATRALNFRVTIRDNRAGGGGVAQDNTVLTVVKAAGPFIVTSQNTAGLSFVAGSSVTVNWNVASTAAAPINATNVNVRFSTDGGNNFNYVLAANVANSGAATVVLPYVPTSATCRFKVEPTANVFFAINTRNFTVTAATDTDADGMPDAYESANGLNPNLAADAAQDADGDGKTNLEEFRAGTDPRNSADYLRITSNTRDVTGQIIVFPTKLARNYRVERSTNLTGAWTTIFNNIPGTGGNISRTDTTATGSAKYFYRAVATP